MTAPHPKRCRNPWRSAAKRLFCNTCGIKIPERSRIGVEPCSIELGLFGSPSCTVRLALSRPEEDTNSPKGRHRRQHPPATTLPSLQLANLPTCQSARHHCLAQVLPRPPHSDKPSGPSRALGLFALAPRSSVKTRHTDNSAGHAQSPRPASRGSAGKFQPTRLDGASSPAARCPFRTSRNSRPKPPRSLGDYTRSSIEKRF